MQDPKAILIPLWLLAATAWGCAADGDAVQERPAADDVPQSGPHLVVVRMTDEMTFIPENPTISVGDTVVWINEGAMPHTTTNTPGTAGVAEHNVLPAGAEPWDSGLLGPGERFRWMIETPGEYTYLCYLHEAAGMVAELTVVEGDE